MTTLAIMATYEKKRLKCYGTVAAGEHVAVTVTDGAQWVGEGKALRLRVLFGPNTVAVFPFAEGDAWTAAGTQNADAYCELNLNTLQVEKYLKHGGTCLWILDDVENHTLYATGEFDVLPWPKRRGIDEPIDLDGYPQLIEDMEELKTAWAEYQTSIAQQLAAKQDVLSDLAAIRNGAAAGTTAVQPAQIARFVDDAEYKAQYGEQNKPAILFKHGTDVIVALDATPLVKDGMVSSVEVVGGNLVITFNTDSGKQPITVPLTDIFDPDNYYDKDAVDNLLDGKQDALTFDNAPTSGSDNPVKSGGIWSAIWGALAALPTGFTSLYDWCVSQLAGKASTADATLTNKYTDWVVVGNLPSGSTWISSDVWYDPSDDYWKTWLHFNDGEDHVLMKADGAPYTALELTFEGEYDGDELSMTTRRSFSGYQLGSQSDKPLASEAEAEALRTGKLDKSAVVSPSSSATAGQAADAKATGDALGLIAPDWMQTSAYAAYDCVKYNGAYYYAKQNIAANTAWNANNWGSLANLAAVVKKFLPLTGGEVSGDLIVDGQVDISSFFSISKSLGSGLVFSGRINNVERKALLPLYKVFNSSGFAIAFLQNLAPDYDATSTYELNNLRVHSVGLYRCTTAITTAEAWTPAHWTEATVEDVLAALRTALDGKANRAASPTAGNLAALDANGNPTDSAIPAANVALTADIPYALVTKTISNNTVTLDDRASNSVTISATLSPNTLTINFPTATSGKVRDFAMRLNIAAGVTAPEIAWPQGVTLENNGGEVPEIADGGTGGSSTILYFSETENNGTTAKFLVKGETLTAIAQA